MRNHYKILAEKYKLLTENDHNAVPSHEDALVYPKDYTLEVTIVLELNNEGREVPRPVYKLTHKLYHEYSETISHPDEMEQVLFVFESSNPKGIIGL
jgi:hypothetical protein